MGLTLVFNTLIENGRVVEALRFLNLMSVRHLARLVVARLVALQSSTKCNNLVHRVAYQDVEMSMVFI